MFAASVDVTPVALLSGIALGTSVEVRVIVFALGRPIGTVNGIDDRARRSSCR